MTKEFEQIRQQIEPFNHNIEQRRINEKTEAENRDSLERQEILAQIKRDKEILEKSGIKNLFQEIVDSGLIKWNDTPIYKTIPIYKENFFGKKNIDHYETQKKSDYTPAIIEESSHDNHYDVLSNMRNKRIVYIALHFNGSTFEDKESITSSYSEVRIAVWQGKLSLAKRKGFDYEYNPIEMENLPKTIVEAIKNPIFH
jgi:hypothetical protein